GGGAADEGEQQDRESGLQQLGWSLAGVCGLDARPLTLRQLCAAAKARRQEEWDRTAFLCSWFALKLTGQQINPDVLNPYPKPAAARKRGPVSEAENRLAWKLLGQYLGDKRCQ